MGAAPSNREVGSEVRIVERLHQEDRHLTLLMLAFGQKFPPPQPAVTPSVNSPR